MGREVAIPRRRLNLNLPEILMKEIRKYCKRRGITVTTFLVEAAWDYLEKK